MLVDSKFYSGRCESQYCYIQFVSMCRGECFCAVL